jgi:hypothetical protein
MSQIAGFFVAGSTGRTRGRILVDLLRRAGGAVRRIARGFAKRRARARSRRQFSSLSPHLRRDVGLEALDTFYGCTAPVATEATLDRQNSSGEQP